MKFTIITKENCPDCVKLKGVLGLLSLTLGLDDKIEYKSLDEYGKDNLIRLGILGVPVIINNENNTYLIKSTKPSEVEDFLKK